MAAPRADSYPASSGAVVNAGRFALPSFVPAPGGTANVGLNSLTDVATCPSGLCWYSQGTGLKAPWINWCGAVYAPDFSPLGAMLYWGGGHSGGQDTTIFAFDFSTRLWSTIGPVPATTLEALGAEDATFGDYSWSGSKVLLAVHTYNYVTYIPANTGGAGSKGAWLITIVNSGGAPAGANPHMVDLETGVWSRCATGTSLDFGSSSGMYGAAFLDTARNKVWYAAADSNNIFSLDLEASMPQSVAYTHDCWWSAYYAGLVYVPEVDMAISFYMTAEDGPGGDVFVRVFDMSSGSPTNASCNHPPAHTMNLRGFGFDWCPITEKFYLYEGKGYTTVHVLVPSSLDFTTCTWTWETETFSDVLFNPIEAGEGNFRPYSRWKYIPKLRCFAFATSDSSSGATTSDSVVRNGVMQLWRPAGT